GPQAQALQDGVGGEPAPARRRAGIGQRRDGDEPAAVQQEEEGIVTGAVLDRAARPEAALVAAGDGELDEARRGGPGERRPEDHDGRSSSSAKAAVKPGPRLDSRRRRAFRRSDCASTNSTVTDDMLPKR